MSSTWTVGLEARYIEVFNQLDNSINAEDNCAPTTLATVNKYLSGVRVTPAYIHDKGWGSGYIGPTDVPQIKAVALRWLGIPITEHHLGSKAEVAGCIYTYLHAELPPIVYITEGGVGHWILVTQMVGGASSDPCDYVEVSDPYGGLLYPQNYQDFSNTLRRYYVDNKFLVLGCERQRSVVLAVPLATALPAPAHK